MADEIPKRITEDQYDKLIRRLWEMEQRLAFSEKASLRATDDDMLYDKQREIEKRLERIERTLLMHASIRILELNNGKEPGRVQIAASNGGLPARDKAGGQQKIPDDATLPQPLMVAYPEPKAQ